MVEIRYSDNYELADLAGRTVAEVREQYSSEFDIPDKAQVRVNDKLIKSKHEHETELNSNDKLHFQDRSRKGLLLFVPIVLFLVVTSGVFAYGATTTTVGLALTDQPDFASVVAAGSPPTWNVFGSYRGTVAAGDLFTITPDANFTGDMVVVLTVTNVHDLVDTYRIMVLEIMIMDSAGTPVQVGTTEYLGLAKGEATIEIDQTGLTAPYDVQIASGFYITHRGGWTSGKEDPTILCDVMQKGTQ